MEEVTAAGQPAAYLESLLDRLACPLDNSVPLSAVRDADGEIVALRSRDAEYRVVRNVPCLVPELGRGAGGDLPLWQGHQKKMWQEHQEGEEGVFSVPVERLRPGANGITLANPTPQPLEVTQVDLELDYE